MNGEIILSKDREPAVVASPAISLSNEGAVSPLINDFVAFTEAGRLEREKEKGLPMISVSAAASTIAVLYERLRNTIEYKAEHLLRRNAIQRILARLINNGISDDKLSQTLIRELIWARYLKNDSVPQIKIKEIAKIITKYRLLISGINSPFTAKSDFITSLASVEIERRLVPPYLTDGAIRLMTKVFSPENDRQIFIAVCRSLVKLDSENLSYFLFNLICPTWDHATNDEITQTAIKIPEIESAIKKELNHPLSEAYFKFLKKYTPPFLVIEDIVEKNGAKAREIFADIKLFENEAKNLWQKRFQGAKNRFRKEAVRSVIFIFLTKMLMAFLLEVPFDLVVSQKLKLLPLGINMFFPPLLMFLVVTTIRLPGEENTLRLIELAKEVVYTGKIANARFIPPPPPKRDFRHAFFKGLFGMIFILLFSVTIYLLFRLTFNALSAGIFIFFLSVIMFFGFLIRDSARELVVVKEKEGLFTALIDIISLPFLNVGSWLSKKIGKINIFTFIFDVVIETPVKSFIQIAEDWIGFLRERREQTITNIPR